MTSDTELAQDVVLVRFGWRSGPACGEGRARKPGHRAQGLADADAAAPRSRCTRAGRYHWWRVANESHDMADATEALRNHLAGASFDEAVGIAKVCFQALTEFRQAVGIAALAAEVLEHLPASHPDFAFVADEEARAHLALGQTQRAFSRYQGLLEAQQQRVHAEPDRADHQRDLSVSFERMGDLYLTEDQPDLAAQEFRKSRDICQRLCETEPTRADLQRGLVIPLLRLGTLPRPDADAHLANAWQMLSDLVISGRLNPADQGLVDHVREPMTQRGLFTA